MDNTVKGVEIDQFRKKLIDAVNNAIDARTGQDLAERIADHFIANGGIIPVRCKDCMFYEWNPFDGCEVCTRGCGYVRPDFGCVDGERKDHAV